MAKTPAKKKAVVKDQARTMSKRKKKPSAKAVAAELDDGVSDEEEETLGEDCDIE